MGALIRKALFILALAFLVSRLAQPAVQSYQFEKLVRQELASARVRPDAGAIHGRILDQGRGMGMRLTPADIEISRVVRGYQVNVKYAAPLDLLVYKTEVHLNYVTRTAEVE